MLQVRYLFLTFTVFKFTLVFNCLRLLQNPLTTLLKVKNLSCLTLWFFNVTKQQRKFQTLKVLIFSGTRPVKSTSILSTKQFRLYMASPGVFIYLFIFFKSIDFISIIIVFEVFIILIEFIFRVAKKTWS